jgi:hypothetical protein
MKNIMATTPYDSIKANFYQQVNDGNRGSVSAILESAEETMAENLLNVQYRGLNNILQNFHDCGDYTPLKLAIYQNNTDMALLLLQKGANPNVGSYYVGINSLMAAIMQQNKVIAETLIIKGVDTNYEYFGESSLDYAKKYMPELVPTLEPMMNNLSHVEL